MYVAEIVSDKTVSFIYKFIPPFHSLCTLILVADKSGQYKEIYKLTLTTGHSCEQPKA
jgi:hypothetical protein